MKKFEVSVSNGINISFSDVFFYSIDPVPPKRQMTHLFF